MDKCKHCDGWIEYVHVHTGKRTCNSGDAFAEPGDSPPLRCVECGEPIVWLGMQTDRGKRKKVYGHEDPIIGHDAVPA